jgi:hypothetical protein
MTAHRRIELADDIYEDLFGGSPSNETIGIVAEEIFHSQEQWASWGDGFLIEYLKALILKGYRDNPFEEDAIKKRTEVLDDLRRRFPDGRIDCDALLKQA